MVLKNKNHENRTTSWTSRITFFSNSTNFLKGTYQGWMNGNGERHGVGLMNYSHGRRSGGRYEGDWNNDLREGKGVFFSRRLTRFEGEYKKGLANGMGKWFFQSGRIRFRGMLVDGKPHGNGTSYYSNGTRKYEGDYVKWKKHGKGIWYRKNGNIRYIGMLGRSRRHGEGMAYYENGGKFEGEFRMGKYHGKGFYFDKENNLVSEMLHFDGVLASAKVIDPVLEKWKFPREDEKGRVKEIRSEMKRKGDLGFVMKRQVIR